MHDQLYQNPMLMKYGPALEFLRLVSSCGRKIELKKGDKGSGVGWADGGRVGGPDPRILSVSAS